MEFVISHDPEFRFETYGTLVCDYPYLATDLVVGDCVKIDS